MACGTGRIISFSENYFDESVGVDISQEMLEKATLNCKKSSFYNYDIEEIKDIGRFDVITMFRFFLNAETELRKNALVKVHELLKPEGKFITNIHVSSQSIRGICYKIRNKIKRKNVSTFSDITAGDESGKLL